MALNPTPTKKDAFIDVFYSENCKKGMLKCIHVCVDTKRGGIPLFVPVDKEHIIQYPLPADIAAEKDDFLKAWYHREYPALEPYIIWIEHEGLQLQE